MFNDTVNVQVAIDRLRDAREYSVEVLDHCLELLKRHYNEVPTELPVSELLKFVHQAEVAINRHQIEAAMYAQTISFNSDP